MSDYERAQALAEAQGEDCWKVFGCEIKVDTMLGVRCKGNCQEALERKKMLEQCAEHRRGVVP